MAVLVSFHAHPDDEAIATSGSMAKAKAAGHRVVLVVATRGEHGEVDPGFLSDGEQLGLRRVHETFRAAEIIGADRVEFLGYVDSGMMGEPTNDEPYSFWGADIDQAADRLAAILREEQANGPVVLTIYDERGNYGHPDHIQVHRVGHRAAELVDHVRVFESTMNRDHIRRLMIEAREDDSPENAELRAQLEAEGDNPEEFDIGMPEEVITHAVDVTAFTDVKKASMRAHASQISDEFFFLAMPDDAFARSFGLEWYIGKGYSRAEHEPFADDLFADLT